MEGYKKAAIIVGIIQLFICILIAVWIPELAVISFFVTVGMMALLLIPSSMSHKPVGIIAVVLAIIFSWIMIIPAIMAIRYKPKRSGVALKFDRAE